MTNVRKTMMIFGGAALAAAAFVFRGTVPELVRYLRIRKM